MATSLPTVHLWALAAGANLTRSRGDRLDTLELGKTTAEAARDTLERWWDVTKPADVEPTLAWLRDGGHTAALEEILRETRALPPAELEAYVEAKRKFSRHQIRYAQEHRDEFRDGKLEAWDMVRLSFVARAAFTAGWLSKRATWDTVFEAARRLQRGYSSWNEMSENYLLGRRFWAGGDPKEQKVFDHHAKWLTTHPESPWQHLPWHLSLKPNFWNRYP